MGNKRTVFLKKEEIESWISSGGTIASLAKSVNVTPGYISQYANKLGVPPRKIGRPKGTPMSDKQKKEQGKRVSGVNNPFYGKKHSYKTKIKMSKNHADFTGDKNPFKKALIKNPEKMETLKKAWRNWWDNLSEDEMNKIKESRSHIQASLKNYSKMSNHKSGFFDSKKGGRIFHRSSWELKFAEKLDENNLIKSFELEPFCVPYVDKDGLNKKTRIDFLINFVNGNVAIVEVKPKSLMKFGNNKEKISGQRKYCDENGHKYAVLSDIESINSFIIELNNK